MSRDTSQLLIDEIEADCNDFRDKTLDSDAEFDDWIMTNFWLTTNVGKCLGDLRWAVEDINQGIRYFLSRSFIYDYKYTIPYWMSHFGGGVITWKTIAEAWSADDFEGRFWTIALIDRMRQLLWNEPFNITWAARPEEQDM